MNNLTITNCLICQNASKPLRHFSKFRGENTFLYKCTKCKIEFLYPQPSDNWLGKEYKNYFKKRETSIKHTKVSYFLNLHKDLGFYYDNTKIIDFGSAEGDNIIALNALAKNVKIYSVENNTESEKLFENINCMKYSINIEEWLDLKLNVQFDYIMLFDVIEHLREPYKVLERLLKNHCNRQGVIIITAPYINTFSKFVLNRIWFQYKVEHLFYFSKNSINYIEKQLNCDRLLFRKHSKYLTIEYLLNIGTRFGPIKFIKLIKLVKKIIPKYLYQKNIKLPLGEMLWVIKNK